MNKYKTYEVIKWLELYPNRKFKDSKGRIAESVKGNVVIKFKDTFSLLDINETWTQVQKPMYFMEAINTGKKIKLQEWQRYWLVTEALTILEEKEEQEVIKLLNKKCWYVEEE